MSSLLKTLHKHNFSKYPIESVRNRIGNNNYNVKPKTQYTPPRPVQSDSVTISAKDGKVFGVISKDAYTALSNGTLENYQPKNDNERRVLEEYKNYPTIPLSSPEEDSFGTVSYNTLKSLKNGEKVSMFYDDTEKNAVNNYNLYVDKMQSNVSGLVKNYGIQELLRARYFAGNGGEKPSENSDTYEADLAYWKSNKRHIKELDIAINSIIDNYGVADFNENIIMLENILEGHNLKHPGNLTVEKDPYQKADAKYIPTAINYLTQRRNQRLVSHPEETPDNGLVYMGKNAYHSLERFGVGIQNSADFLSNIFASEEDKNISNQRIKGRSAYLKDRYADIQRNRPNASAALNGLMSSTAQTVGMVPAAVATYINPAFGTAVIAADGFGNNYGEALVEGATPGEAFTYALGSTAIEVAIERLIGNKLMGGEGILNKQVSRTISRVAKRPATQAAFKFIVNVLGEGGEEVATTAILPWVKRAIYDPDAELPTAEQLVEAGIGGMIGGTIWEGAGLATSGKRMGQSIENTVHNTDNYDVDLAIGNIMDGKATIEDFKLFEPGNTENRQLFYETTGMKLPENSQLSYYRLINLNNRNRMFNLYSNQSTLNVDNLTLPEYRKHLEKPDSLTPNGESVLEKMRINEKTDREQYMEYISILGKDNMPESFDKFQFLKYNNINEWTMLKNYANSIKTGELSPLASFDLYKEINKEIDEKFVGVITKNGLEVTGKSIHFIARTIGSVEHRRNGVSLDDSLLTITHPERVDAIKNNVNGNSQRFIGEKAVVTINPDTGNLIQVNPRSKANKSKEEY